MTDFIGDIHGHADKLKELLTKLGYTIKNGSYHNPDRKVVFVGDYIDRGPKIKETLKMVRSMEENKDAIALLGNHEYNALCFHFEEKEGGHLRKHLIKNVIQHYKTLRQFQNKQKEYEDYLDWFKTLPLFYESANFRVVHACWDNEHINYLRSILKDDRLSDDIIHQSVKKGTKLNIALDETLKGKEIKMPSGASFTDKDGHERTEIRVKWWENPLTSTYKNISVEPLDNLPNELVDKSAFKNANYYNQDDKPVFFGHYWLKGNPMLPTDRYNICCLDYSVAKNGYLAAYRFDNELKLDENKFIFV